MDSIENISKKTCGLSELIANLNTDDVDVDTGDMDDDEVVRIISRADNREKKMFYLEYTLNDRTVTTKQED
jgi:hypothetical protein